MKLKFKKGIKSILAFAMAMIMALLPVGDILPEVFAADEVTVTLDYSGITKVGGTAVTADDISTTPNSTGDTSTNGKISWTVNKDTSLEIKIAYSDSVSYIWTETVNTNKNLTKDDFSKKVVNAQKVITVKATDATVTSITTTTNDNKVTYDANRKEATVAEQTALTTEVKITFTLPVGKTATGGDVEYSKYLKETQLRTYTYKTTVASLIAKDEYDLNSFVPMNEAAVYPIEISDSTKVTLNWQGQAGDTVWKKDNTHYYALEGSEYFTIKATPKDGYRVTAQALGTPLVTENLEDGQGSIKITVNAGTTKVKIETTPLSINAPQGTMTISPSQTGTDYYKKGESFNANFKPDDGTGNVSYDLEWAVVDSTSSVPSTWNPATYDSQTGSYNIIGVQGIEGKDRVYIAYHYKNRVSGTVSDTKYTDEIKFDITAPAVVSSVTKVGDITVTGNAWVNNDNKDKCSIIVKAQDTESGLGKLTYTICTSNDGTSTILKNDSVELNESGEYEIPYPVCKNATLTYTIKDKAGNETGEQTLTLSLRFDLTAPKIADIRILDADGNEIDDISKWQAGNVAVVVTPAEVSSNNQNEISSGVKYIIVNDNGIEERHEPDSTTGTYVLNLTTDGAHGLSIQVEDGAGNKSPIGTTTVKLDKTGIQNATVFLSSVNSGNIDPTQTEFAKEFTIIAQATSVSGIEKKKVEITVDTGNGDFVIPSESFTINKESGDVYTIICKYTPETSEFKGKIRVKFVDNVATKNSTIDGVHVKVVDHDLIYNRNGAKISILGNTSWTNEDVRLNIAASSKSTTITEIRYYVNGTLVQTIPVNDLQYADTGFTIRENSSMAGTEVRVEAVCGTNPESQIVNSESIVVRVDKQAPALRLAGVTEGAVYNTNRALQITTVENVYNAMKPVQVTATRTIDGATTNIDLGAYQVQSGSDVTNKIFTEDGVYRVTVLAEDAAGNRDSKTVSFTIDKTAPVLNITGVTEGAYSNRPVTLNFQSIESFFETNNVRIMVERRLDGTTYGRNVIFANTAKNSSVSNTFSEDGDYTITMSAIDAAGNEAAVKTLTFTVDCTAPVVSLTGTKDYFVTQSAVALDFSVIESYYQTNQVQIQASRRLANGKVETVSIPAWSNSGKNSSLRQQFTEDGYYTVNITATDKAGNRKEQTIHFTIDTEKPVIADLSKYDGKYLKSFRLEEDMDTLITELTVPTVKMTLNGEAYDGSEVTADGKYTFVIEVTDEVGLTASKTIEFVIDNTLPKIIFAGAEDGKWYTDVVRLNVSLENENDTITEILINGEPYTLTEGKTAYDLTFDTFGDYEVTINSVDAAGNTNSQTISFTYAEHKKVAWLWIGVGAVVLLAGVGAGVMVFLKKGNTNADA